MAFLASHPNVFHCFHFLETIIYFWDFNTFTQRHRVFTADNNCNFTFVGFSKLVLMIPKVTSQRTLVLSKGKAWYETMGFKPIKRSGHTFHGGRQSYSQHPAQFRAGVVNFVGLLEPLVCNQNQNLWISTNVHFGHFYSITSFMKTVPVPAGTGGTGEMTASEYARIKSLFREPLKS